MSTVINESAADLAAKIKTGELTSVALTQACLDRIAAVDGEVHAFHTVTEERALADARAAEARPPSDSERPLTTRSTTATGAPAPGRARGPVPWARGPSTRTRTSPFPYCEGRPSWLLPNADAAQPAAGREAVPACSESS